MGAGLLTKTVFTATPPAQSSFPSRIMNDVYIRPRCRASSSEEVTLTWNSPREDAELQHPTLPARGCDVGLKFEAARKSHLGLSRLR